MNGAIKIISKTLITKISHISCGGYGKCFYGKANAKTKKTTKFSKEINNVHQEKLKIDKKIQDKFDRLMLSNIFQNKIIARKHCAMDGCDLTKINIDSIEREISEEDQRGKNGNSLFTCKMHSISAVEKVANLIKYHSSTPTK